MQQKNFLSPAVTLKSELRLFGNVRVLVCAALFIALSIILGKYLSFTIGGVFRISFENLTLLMGGIFFGPIVGMIVGIAADLIGCLLVGYAINPIITLGAAMIGLLSGLIVRGGTGRSGRFSNGTLRTLTAVAAAHIVGSMLIKSIGLHVYYGTPFAVLVFRIPLYIVIGFLEFYIINLLLKNQSFVQQIDRMCKK